MLTQHTAAMAFLRRLINRHLAWRVLPPDIAYGHPDSNARARYDHQIVVVRNSLNGNQFLVFSVIFSVLTPCPRGPFFCNLLSRNVFRIRFHSQPARAVFGPRPGLRPRPLQERRIRWFYLLYLHISCQLPDRPRLWRCRVPRKPSVPWGAHRPRQNARTCHHVLPVAIHNCRLSGTLAANGHLPGW